MPPKTEKSRSSLPWLFISHPRNEKTKNGVKRPYQRCSIGRQQASGRPEPASADPHNPFATGFCESVGGDLRYLLGPADPIVFDRKTRPEVLRRTHSE